MKTLCLASGLVLMLGGAALAQQNDTQSAPNSGTPNANAPSTAPSTMNGNATAAARANRNKADNDNSQDHMDAEARGNGQAPTGADANQPARSTQTPDR